MVAAEKFRTMCRQLLIGMMERIRQTALPCPEMIPINILLVVRPQSVVDSPGRVCYSAGLMRLKRDHITTIARTLVEQLTSHKAIQLNIPKADLVASVERAMTEELSLEDRLDADVRKILEKYEREIEKGEVDERQMFLMIKKQLAKDRGLIL